jgi:signal transduction histidine kinase
VADPQDATNQGRPGTDARVSGLADAVRGLYAYSTTTLVATLLGAAAVGLLFRRQVGTATLLAWLLPMAALWAARLVLARRFAAEPPADAARLRFFLNAWRLVALLNGAAWGAAAWLFYHQGDSLDQTALLLVIYSFCVGSVPVMATQYPVFFGFVALAFAPTIWRVATMEGSHGTTLAVILGLIFGVTALVGRNYRTAYDHVVALKAEQARLLAQLRIEKAAADAARAEAEAASRAKTQFFAAASHDLRQPLHALVLFAEALRLRSDHNTEALHLVNSINSSVDALEGLFSELLDITRIDTGGVEVKPANFSVDDVFRRLKLHFEPTAFEKGLALHWRGGAHWGFADPLLVERVLRNLLSNAIRYSEDGGVLVSARPRSGRLLLQVWDTGPGIRPKEQARIFEEFYQVSDDAPLAPHQRKGLGLGLAIVRRLANLMNAPLALRSKPGHGSVFTLDIPVGKAVRPSPAELPGRKMLGLTLDRRLMLIVEDDDAVRHGLEVLLKGWGASVIAFDSLRACAQWASAVETSQVKPDLALLDFRLESGHTGVEVLALLRHYFGPALPAVVITGSIMSGHDAEAQRHNFHLLLKPVVPNKLRAMIAFKLGLR